MTSDTVVRARVSGDVKDEATHVLEKIGLTVSDAIRLMLIRVAREKALPFDVRVPNDETAAAIAELESGGGKSFAKVADLLADLHEDD